MKRGQRALDLDGDGHPTGGGRGINLSATKLERNSRTISREIRCSLVSFWIKGDVWRGRGLKLERGDWSGWRGVRSRQKVLGIKLEMDEGPS